MRSMWFHCVPILLTFAMFGGLRVQAITLDQIDDFEDGTVQGWREGGSLTNSPNAPMNVATGGNPGGFIEDRSSGSGRAGSRWVMYNQSQWTGNYFEAGVSQIDFDLKNLSPTAPLSMRVALQGAGSQYSSTNAVVLPADDQWHTLSFGLSSDDLTRVSGRQSLDTVLSRVDTLRILVADRAPAWRGDEIVANLGIDNISALGTVVTPLQAGDADQDFDFDQRDLVQVQIAAKYLTGQPATWGEGDWNGAPGGSQGNPPAGDGRFNQLDIVASQQAGIYLTGPYAAVQPNGQAGDGQTSVVYNAVTGEIAVDALGAAELTSINIDSATGVFTGAPARNLGGSFDNDADTNIFKATFGSSFGSLSFGNVAQTGLTEQFVLNDFTVIGSLAGGGALGDVDLIYVPEPAAATLFAAGLMGLAFLLPRTGRMF